MRTPHASQRSLSLRIYFKAMGAQIEGAGTSVIRVEGVPRLHLRTP